MTEQVPTKEQGMPEAGQACENTDRHLWPLVSKPDDPYESIHVTKEGNIGINVCGNVLVMPLREWHRRAGGTLGRALGDEQGPSKDLSAPAGMDVYDELDWWREKAQRLHQDLERVTGEREPPHCVSCSCHMPDPTPEAIRALWNKAVIVQDGNRATVAFETADEAEAAFDYIHALGTIPEPGVPLTYESFWEHVRASGWNPSPEELRKLLTAQKEREAGSGVPSTDLPPGAGE